MKIILAYPPDLWYAVGIERAIPMKFHVDIYKTYQVGPNNTEDKSCLQFLLDEKDLETAHKIAEEVRAKKERDDELGESYYMCVTPWEKFEKNLHAAGVRAVLSIKE